MNQEWFTVADPAECGGRGIGVLEMARAIRHGEAHRATAENALHILDVMAAVEESAKLSVFTGIQSGFTPPILLPASWAHDTSTLG